MVLCREHDTYARREVWQFDGRAEVHPGDDGLVSQWGSAATTQGTC